MIQKTRLNQGQIEFYTREGYLIIECVLSRSDAKQLRREVLNVVQKVTQGHSKLHQTTQYLRGGAIDDLVNSSEALWIAEQLMHGSSTLYMPFTAVKSGGGQGGQFHFHQDNQYTEFDGPGINLWFALEDMTPANGCLQIIPDSHAQGTLPSVPSGDGDQHKKISWEPTDAHPMLMQAGDCVAFSRLTVHGSAPNSTAQARVAYALQFHRDDVRARHPDGKWHLLKSSPRWRVDPVDEIKPGVERRLFK